MALGSDPSRNLLQLVFLIKNYDHVGIKQHFRTYYSLHLLIEMPQCLQQHIVHVLDGSAGELLLQGCHEGSAHRSAAFQHAAIAADTAW